MKNYFSIILMSFLFIFSSCSLNEKNNEVERFKFNNSYTTEVNASSEAEFVSLYFDNDNFIGTFNASYNINVNSIQGTTITYREIENPFTSGLAVVGGFNASYYTYKFEDLFPSLGDYDFNDYVFNITQEKILNNQNVPQQINFSIVQVTNGTQKDFGLGVQFFLRQQNGLHRQLFFDTLSSNDVFQNNDGRSFVLVDSLSRFQYKLNTFTGDVNVPDTLNFSFDIDTSKLHNTINTVSTLIARFYLVDSSGKEIHTAGYPPTSFADMSWLNTRDDVSDASFNFSEGMPFAFPQNFHFSSDNMPWGIFIQTPYPQLLPVTNEKTNIEDAFPEFRAWADSFGEINQFWFENPNEELVIQF